MHNQYKAHCFFAASPTNVEQRLIIFVRLKAQISPVTVMWGENKVKAECLVVLK